MRSILKYFLIVVWMVIYSCDTIAPPYFPPHYPSDEYPAWSPDGKWIAYRHISSERTEPVYPTGLYIIDPSGQEKHLLIDVSAEGPDWSPDSNFLIFNVSDYGVKIFTISIETKEQTQITNIGNAFSPNFSPDGKKIAFEIPSEGSFSIWIYSVDKKIKKHLGLGRYPDWHFSGEKIVYAAFPDSTNAPLQIWTADTSGYEKTQLTANNFINRYPSWSPDGEKIAWSIIGNVYYSEIWIMNADGSDQRYLTTGDYPSWSPDSKKLVFMKPASGVDEGVRSYLWIIDLETNQIERLTY